MEELKLAQIPISQIRSFGGDYGKAYFTVRREKVQELEESIRSYGILEPLIVRPDPLGEAAYELLAGRTRMQAAENIGLTEVPCLIKDYDGELSACVYGETNRYREVLSITEKAYMLRYDEEYKVKKCNSVVHCQNALLEETGVGESMKRRYIRLTYLVPELQHLVNVKRISIDAAAAASYLPDDIQASLYFALDGTKLILTMQAIQKIKDLWENHRKPFGKTVRLNDVYTMITESQGIKEKVNVSIAKDIVKALEEESGGRRECEKIIEKILENYLTNKK